MHFSTKMTLASGLLLTLATPTLLAKVPAEQAAQLGGDKLTYIGAEKAANADGSIPAWDGGFPQSRIPANWKPGDVYTNPWPEDKPLFTITAQNVAQYKEKLTPGQLALFEKYPATYKIPVYVSRRTATVPDRVKESIKYNAANATLANQGKGVANYKEVTPFPITSDGLEAIWNHIFRWRGGIGVIQNEAGFAPQVDGSATKVSLTVNFWFNPEAGKAGSQYENIIFMYTSEVTAPSRLAGSPVLLHESIDQSREPRLVWRYNAGQRRVARAPDVGFDNPSDAADGLLASDQVDMYNGSPERYDWKLLGKKEIYIPYNNYEMNQPAVKYKDLLTPGHLNQQWSRYEPHRVWVVEAKLKADQRHIYSRRVMFLDEDTWQVAEHDMYDGKDQLWRVQEGYHTHFWDASTGWVQVYTTNDLNAKRYYARGFVNEEKPYEFTTRFSFEDFTPAALRRKGVR